METNTSIQQLQITQKHFEKECERTAHNQPTVNNIILWKAFKKLSFTLRRLLSKTFSIPSLLSVSDKSTCVSHESVEVLASDQFLASDILHPRE
jgi:hypothetical protein